jgi:hypothetical protein
VIVEYGCARRNGRQHALPTAKDCAQSEPSYTGLLLGRLTLANFTEKYPRQRTLSATHDDPKNALSFREKMWLSDRGRK